MLEGPVGVQIFNNHIIPANANLHNHYPDLLNPRIELLGPLPLGVRTSVMGI